MVSTFIRLQGAFVSYWLGGVDYFEEGTWQWANGDPFEYSNWHEGEPNNVDNEVRVAGLVRAFNFASFLSL